jgi:hypothetical protein
MGRDDAHGSPRGLHYRFDRDALHALHHGVRRPRQQMPIYLEHGQAR